MSSLTLNTAESVINWMLEVKDVEADGTEATNRSRTLVQRAERKGM
jgi:hypothetical protein